MPMRIVVAGGTGFVGRALRARAEGEGHEVVSLSRRPGPGSVVWDAASSGPWQRALDGADAVVNLAGEPVAGGRWTEALSRRCCPRSGSAWAARWARAASGCLGSPSRTRPA